MATTTTPQQSFPSPQTSKRFSALQSYPIIYPPLPTSAGLPIDGFSHAHTYLLLILLEEVVVVVFLILPSPDTMTHHEVFEFPKSETVDDRHYKIIKIIKIN
jgi:hypothetical protein